MRRSGLPRYKALDRRSAIRRAKIVAAKVRYTGPSLKTRRLVRERAGDMCEWPDCRRVGTDYHHRLNRKAGGRKGERAVEINAPSWIVLACREHHDEVTSPVGEQRQRALGMGWLLLEYQTACDIPIAMDGGAFFLDDWGGKTPVSAP